MQNLVTKFTTNEQQSSLFVMLRGKRSQKFEMIKIMITSLQVASHVKIGCNVQSMHTGLNPLFNKKYYVYFFRFRLNWSHNISEMHNLFLWIIIMGSKLENIGDFRTVLSLHKQFKLYFTTLKNLSDIWLNPISKIYSLNFKLR